MQVIRLDPLVRRALSSQSPGALLPAQHLAQQPSLPRCRRCHGTGIAPATSTRGQLCFRACVQCRSDELFLVVWQVDNQTWMGSRLEPDLCVAADTPVEVLLELERHTDPERSIYAPCYLLPETEPATTASAAQEGASLVLAG
jgi:hypothetical protein